jgi:hypothetical protein
MAILHCPVCGVATAVSDSDHDPPPREGLGHVGAECTLHHPSDEHRKELAEAPVKVVMLKSEK